MGIGATVGYRSCGFAIGVDTSRRTGTPTQGEAMIRNHRSMYAVIAFLVLLTACGGADTAAIDATSEAPTTTNVPASLAEATATTSVPAPAAATPSARGYHALAYDAESDIILMVGGSTGADPMSTLGDAWILDPSGAAWSEIEAPAVLKRSAFEQIYSPSPVAYDSAADRVIYLQTAAELEQDEVGTWAYDANTNSWADLAPDPQPTLGFGAGMAYDSESDRTIAFGGAGFAGDEFKWTPETWAYDYNSNVWEPLEPESEPPPTNYHAMVYDAESDRVVLIGMNYDAMAAMLWAYDYNTNTWEEQTLEGPAIEAADYTQAIYHPSMDRIIVFGGLDGAEEPSNATWLYDLDANEIQLAPANELSGPLAWHDMVYVGSRDQVFVFGGGTSRSTYTDGLWAYEPATDAWVDLSP